MFGRKKKEELSHKERCWLDNLLRKYISEIKAKEINSGADGYEVKIASSIVDKIDYP